MLKEILYRLRTISLRIEKICNYGIASLSILSIICVVYDFGFTHTTDVVNSISKAFNFFTLSFFMLWLVRSISRVVQIRKLKDLSLLRADLVLFIILYLFYKAVVAPNSDTYFLHPYLDTRPGMYALCLLVFAVELGRSSLKMGQKNLNPKQLFIFSFAALILLGTGLLLLPTSTTDGISFLDALFTATSSVCVTGLIVVDTAKDFTHNGQFIIMMLFQIGGLGIMTFTSFIGLFYLGKSSFKNQLLLKDLTNSDKMGEVYKTLLKIISITLAVEAIGAFFLYGLMLNANPTMEHFELLRLAVFHAISAYCNAGFSMWSAGLANPIAMTSAGFQIIITILIILGGLGYPLVFNLYEGMKYRLVNILRKVSGKHIIYKPSVINVNSRLVLASSTILLILGTLFFLICEKDTALVNLPWDEKLLGAWFASVTARTAGFNTLDFATFSNAGILFLLFLMWIGASPLSTGGGIKTTTISIATMAFINELRGKRNTVFHHRQISPYSIHLAQVTIIASILVIGLFCICLQLSDGTVSIRTALFEVVSAISTVGLSLGLTPNLNASGKVIIILAMFIGRVGIVTFLLAWIKQKSENYITYPKEEVLVA